MATMNARIHMSRPNPFHTKAGVALNCRTDWWASQAPAWVKHGPTKKLNDPKNVITVGMTGSALIHLHTYAVHIATKNGNQILMIMFIN